MMPARTSPYRAQWRDADGEVVSQTSDSTICLAPIQPHNFAAASADGLYETVLRCRACIACRRYDALLLRLRLATYFKNTKEAVWAVVCSQESLTLKQLTGRVNRGLTGSLMQGFIRLNSHALVKLAVGPEPKWRSTRRGSPLNIQIFQIAKPWSSRAWRHVCRGLTEPRSSIGAYVNRFYLVDLPKLKEQVFILQKTGGIRKRHPEAHQGMRAWRDGNTLYPSERIQALSVVSSLLAKTSARGSRFTTNSRRLTAAVRILEPLSDQRANPTRARPNTPIYSNRGIDAGSQQILPQWLLDFVAKGTKNPRDA
jgi:hypothetical protein